MPRWSAPLAVTFAVALALRFGRAAGAHPQSANRAAFPWRRRARGRARRSGRLRRAPTPAASSPPISSWIPSSAANATRISTSSGKARCITLHRSITSSTAPPFSTCRRRAAPKAASGAPAATTTPSSSTAASSAPSRSRSKRRKRRTGSAASPATRLYTSTAPWATAISQIMYPPLHRLASSHNPLLHKVDAFLTYLNPEPHRRTFLKPFMREDTSEYLRGVPQGAPGPARESIPLAARLQRVRQLAGERRFRPGRAIVLLSGQTLRLRRLPHAAGAIRSDPGNRDGKVHSHRFAAANTAVASVNHDDAQLRATEAVSAIRVSSPWICSRPRRSNDGRAGRTVEMQRRAGEAPALASTFAVGEEAEQSGPVTIREVGKIAAPLDAAGRGVCSPAARCAWTRWCARARSATSSRAARWMRSTCGWNSRRCDADGRVLAWSGSVADDGPRPGGSRRALLPLLPARRRRQPASTSATPGRRAACCMCG